MVLLGALGHHGTGGTGDLVELLRPVPVVGEEQREPGPTGGDLVSQAGRSSSRSSKRQPERPSSRQVWSCSCRRPPARLAGFGECSARPMLVRGQVAGAELHDGICGRHGATLTATDHGPALGTVGNAGVA